jgi:hypothetical protein
MKKLIASFLVFHFAFAVVLSQQATPSFIKDSIDDYVDRHWQNGKFPGWLFALYEMVRSNS